jgi:hypothetical protein
MSNSWKLAQVKSPTLPLNQQPLVGPQSVRFDTVSMLRWTLMTHGGYATYPHKDANGKCTWMFAHVGVKVWAIMEPKYSSTMHNTRSAQFRLHRQMMDAPFEWKFEKAANMYTTFLEPGDMLYDFSASLYE